MVLSLLLLITSTLQPSDENGDLMNSKPTGHGAVFVQARGSKRKKKQKNAQRRRDEQLQERIDAAKVKLKATRCQEIEEERVSFNCLYYNLSPKCFIDHFGERGLEIGEYVSPEMHKKFNRCWLTQVDKFEHGKANTD